jgi:drug/metabolite transporter (DMT)-like permease
MDRAFEADTLPLSGQLLRCRACPPLAFAAWLYLVVFGSLIAFNAYMLLLARASAGLASSYTFVNPVIAMLLGVAFAGEHVTGFEWAAVSVVLAGVLLLLWRRTS